MNLNSTEQKNSLRAVILADIGLLFVALFWGGGFVAGKFALTIMTPVYIMAYRYTLASVIVFFFCLNKLQYFRDAKNLLYGAITGAMLFVGNTVQMIGLQYTTAGKTSFIMSLYVIIVPLMTWFVLKARPANSILCAAVIGFIGIAFITLTEQFTVGKGDLYTFFFSIMFSAQIVFTSIVVKKVDPTFFTFIQMGVTGLLSFIAAMCMEEPIFPSDILFSPFSGIAGIVYLIFFDSAFAFMLQNLCMKYAPATHVAIIMSMETVFGALAAMTVGGEIFTHRMIFGSVLVLTAIGITEYTTISRAYV